MEFSFYRNLAGCGIAAACFFKGLVMTGLKKTGGFLLMTLGLVGWFLLGLLILALSPLIVGLVYAGAVVFGPDMEGH